ncbi:MAG: hypothetical protein AAB414_01150, partial [Patescibacteria group bacterium]
MAAELDKLAQIYEGKGNRPRAALYKALAAEERAIGGPETVIPVTSPVSEQPAQEVIGEALQPTQETRLSVAELIPTIYVVTRPIEGLTVPSADQLVESARAEIKSDFDRDWEVPTPPQDLFETLEEFAARGITGFDKVYYQPGLQLKENDKFWEVRGRVKPEARFWKQIRDGNYPEEVTRLPEGWFIGDKRGKPMY